MENIVTLYFRDEEVRRVLLPSLILFVATIILSVVLPLMKVIRKETDFKWIHFLAAGTFFSVLAIFVPECIDGKGFLGFVDAVVRTAKMFTFEYTVTENQAFLFGDNAVLEGFGRNYLSFITAIVPAVTVTAVLSLFKDTVAQLRYGFCFLIKAHVFSELNEKSICLANDIRKHERFSQIVFTGVEKDFFEDDSDGLLGQAENLRAIITRKSILDFHCFMHSKPNIYLIDKEESNNVKAGIEIYNGHIDKECNIHIFSTLESAEVFVDAVEKNSAIKARINLVNYAHIVACDILRKQPMFTAADRCNSDTMSVLVVGAGTVGMECAKAAMWCSQMESYKFKIRIVDGENKEDAFISHYGDFKAEMENAGVQIDYDFKVADVNSASFLDVLDECDDANYIIVSTGNDELTINTATKIRKRFIRRAVKKGTYHPRIEPTIIPIISQKANHEAMLNIQKNSDVYKAFYFFGSFSDVYCLKTITDWPVERLAMEVHSLYAKINNQSERAFHTLKQTEKRSNYATAVHTIYKLKDAGIDLCTSKNVRSKWMHIDMGRVQMPAGNLLQYLYQREKDGKTRIDKLAMFEHNRWSVFHILDGWKSWSLGEMTGIIGSSKQHKLLQALLHGCIVPYNKLEEVGNKRYGAPEKFIKNDKMLTVQMLKKMPEFIANHLQTGGDGEELIFYVAKEKTVPDQNRDEPLVG